MQNLVTDVAVSLEWAY